MTMHDQPVPKTHGFAAMRDVRTKRVGDVGYKPGVFDPERGR
jgi:hypothetical protein